MKTERAFAIMPLQEANTRLKRIVYHIDVNSAFLSWEAVYRLHHKGGVLDLREIPSAVGGDMEMRHGIILAKSIPAKKYKVTTGETILEAQRKCPNLVLVIYALSDFLIMILSWLVKQSLRAFLFQEVQP